MTNLERSNMLCEVKYAIDDALWSLERNNEFESIRFDERLRELLQAADVIRTNVQTDYRDG